MSLDDPAMLLDVQAFYSTDAGKTWEHDAGFTTKGGGRDRTGARIDPSVHVEYDPVVLNGPAPGSKVRVKITQTGSYLFGVFAEVAQV